MSKPESPHILPYGTWPSPIGPEAVARASRRLGHVVADGACIYWTESRPEERGRQVIMRAPAMGGVAEAILPPPFSANARVHEYGGGEFIAVDGTVYFVNDGNQDVYCVRPGETPERLTQAPDTRFADFTLDRARRRLICVAERTSADPTRPENLLVAIGLEGSARGAVRPLLQGRDFFANPVMDHEGGRLAWIAWDLPGMPWDEAALYTATIDANGKVGAPRRIAGGDGTAAGEPIWGHDGRLYFISDETGNGAIYCDDGRNVERLTSGRSDLARPMWSLGTRSFAVGRDGRVWWTEMAGAEALILVRRPDDGSIMQRRTGFASLGHMVANADGIGGVAAIAGRPAAPPAVVAFEVKALALSVIREAAAAPIAEDLVSRGQAITFAGGDGALTHAFYYPPRGDRVAGPCGAKPPLLVLAHGGPTGAADAGLKLRIQFYTSRGFAVCDVNYAGSTGFGRRYRERLDGAWGVADVADCAAAARHLAATGRADGARMAIAGGSAGGYTTLMALATTSDFAAGSCHFGIADLGLLLAHTHKFESGYLHRLLGTTRGNYAETFAARSPINHIENIAAPVIIFQGLDDKVVPPEQSRLMHRTLLAKGIASELHEFAGEGHGFRRAETIAAVLEAELRFLVAALRLDHG
ncbi:MAG TPA: prolyl oligopeptidase family serine peptidase [Hyphomicrobiaceae bacterium]|nr:prolyl oligopeptidase family serine peptidase [Hyphomicrobiaceae bacterium]